MEFCSKLRSRCVRAKYLSGSGLSKSPKRTEFIKDDFLVVVAFLGQIALMIIIRLHCVVEEELANKGTPPSSELKCCGMCH